MRMPDPIPSFSFVVEKLAEKHPNLAYIHVVEPRVQGNEDRVASEGEVSEFAMSVRTAAHVSHSPMTSYVNSGSPAP